MRLGYASSVSSSSSSSTYECSYWLWRLLTLCLALPLVLLGTHLIYGATAAIPDDGDVSWHWIQWVYYLIILTALTALTALAYGVWHVLSTVQRQTRRQQSCI